MRRVKDLRATFLRFTKTLQTLYKFRAVLRKINRYDVIANLKRSSFMKKSIFITIAIALVAITAISLVACNAGFNPDKNITVIAREQSSGTREAFDKVVTDGNHFLNEKDADGKTVFLTTSKANVQSKTGMVLSAVQSDKQAIGYVSLGSVDSSVKVVKVAGITPGKETVLNGTYAIQRPFVVMTSNKQALSARVDDFMKYLKSDALEGICDSDDVGTIFLHDGDKRANAGKDAIAVGTFQKQSTLPAGDKIVVRGSTSMEKLINAAAKAYAALYDANASDLFDIQLEGSSVGRKAVEDDNSGNVIGLSSAAVDKDGIDSFNVCLDAVAVIVNKDNTSVDDLTLEQLFKIYTGEITKFSQLG